MPRTEQVFMDDWGFSLNDSKESAYKPVILPHDWVIDMPFKKDMEQGAPQGYRDRLGIGWYRKTFILTKKLNGYRYFLDFGGISENSRIFINAMEAGSQKYGYSPFRLDITKYVNQGENRIEIMVNNTILPADRWYSGGGIYRTVKLIVVEELHFDEREIVIHSKITESNTVISIHTGINGTIRAVLSNGGLKYEAIGDQGNAEIVLASPKLWSAEEPNLYHLTLSLLDNERVADEIYMRIGIRDVQFIPNKGMFVNGKLTKLKGVCLHQDVGCRGIASKQEIWRKRLSLLKEAGFNCIRPSHHIFSSEFLDLCDEMGFYVYEEPFDKWTSGSYARYFSNCWQEDVAAMVKRDRNRPSIVIWGTGNEVENQGQDSMLAILRMIKEHVLSLDSTRPISYAMNPHFKYESDRDASKVKDVQQFVDTADDYSITDLDEKIERISRIANIVDIISCNYQEQWYDDIHRYCPDKLILGTEAYQFFKGDREQLQNYTNENPLLVPFEKNYVIGGIIWTGYDYLGESMGWPAKGWSGALIRTNSEPRFSYYLMQSYWSDKPMVRFHVMDYSLEDEGVKEHWDIPILAEHWHFPQFHKTVIPYMIASNCEEIGLYLNGKRFLTPKPMDCPNRIVTGFLPYLPGSVKVVGYQNGVEVCSHFVSTPISAIRLEFDEPEICMKDADERTDTVADTNVDTDTNAMEGYELLLTVRAKDECGNPYFRESSLVRFRVEGSADICAVDNGCITSNEPYNETSIHMYHGCASVLIRLGKNTGRITIFADASGLLTGKAVITNEKC